MLLSVDSFITESERLDLLCIAYSAENSDWSKKDNSGAYWDGNRFPFQSPIFDSLNKRITSYFDNYSSIGPFASIQRIRTGEGMGEHRDNYHETCNFGCVVYINDDFDGGELVYPRLDISYKPVAGRLVIHAGDEPHLVNPIKNGTRYILTSFVYGTKEQKASVVPS
jgi:hypothetical protein